MIQNLIIGKNSNLSIRLMRKIDNCVLISARDILNNINVLEKYKDCKIRLIFNNFQTSTQLDSVIDPVAYINLAILTTSKVLDYFCRSPIEKIIYTSSSSVYGNNILCAEDDELRPMNLHAALKVANEHLVAKVCTVHGIDYTLTRVFNMYGGDDHFSVISKIINAVQNQESMTIANKGNAIRDFTNIDDVVYVYSKLLNIRDVNILNIGTGNGVSIKGIMDFLHHHDIKLSFNSIERDEIKISTACNKRLTEIIGKIKFVEIEDFLKQALKL